MKNEDAVLNILGGALNYRIENDIFETKRLALNNEDKIKKAGKMNLNFMRSPKKDMFQREILYKENFQKAFLDKSSFNEQESLTSQIDKFYKNNTVSKYATLLQGYFTKLYYDNSLKDEEEKERTFEKSMKRIMVFFSFDEALFDKIKEYESSISRVIEPNILSCPITNFYKNESITEIIPLVIPLLPNASGFNKEKKNTLIARFSLKQNPLDNIDIDVETSLDDMKASFFALLMLYSFIKDSKEKVEYSLSDFKEAFIKIKTICERKIICGELIDKDKSLKLDLLTRVTKFLIEDK